MTRIANQFVETLLATSSAASCTHAGGEKRRSKLRLYNGFTLLELMIVISIIMILMAVAVPVYNQTIIQARESVLRSNLATLRSVIDQYTLDKQKAPQTLQDLVQEGYLSKVPLDPMTGSTTTWRLVMEDAAQSVSQMEPGIFDIHSGSDKMGSDGTPYSEW